MAGTNERFRKLVSDLQRQVNDSFAPGERLPSRRVFAAMYGVGTTTIERALKSLSSTGLVCSASRVGWFRASGSAARVACARGMRVGMLSRYSRPEWNLPLYRAISAEAQRRDAAIIEVPHPHRSRPTPGRARIQLSSVPWNTFDVALLLDAEDTIIAEAATLQKHRVLCVEYDGTSLGLDSVAFDDHDVGAMAARYLLGLGHQRFAVTEDLNDPGFASDPNVNMRRLGFEAEIGQHGGIIMPEWRVMVPRRCWKLRKFDYSAAAAERWAALPKNERPSAIFATAGRLDYLLEQLALHNLRAPENFSVMTVGIEGRPITINGLHISRIELQVAKLASRVLDAAAELANEQENSGTTRRAGRMTFGPALLIPDQSTAAPER